MAAGEATSSVAGHAAALSLQVLGVIAAVGVLVWGRGHTGTDRCPEPVGTQHPGCDWRRGPSGG